MPLNLPNILTILRICLIPVLVILYLLPWKSLYAWVAFVFVLAAVTDWLDGYLARRWRQSSRFGAFLDPVADKLVVAVALVLLVSDAKVHDQVWSSTCFIIATTIIIGREIVISALREWMAEVGERASVAVNFVGKIKTAAQFISIALLLYFEPISGLNTARAGECGLYIASILTLYSMIVYLHAAWPTLRADG